MKLLDAYGGPEDLSATDDPDALDARAIAQQRFTGPIRSARWPTYEWASENPAAHELLTVAKDYDPSQRRDWHGRWASEGVSVAGGEDMTRAAARVVALLRERFVATYEAGEYRWNLNEYQKAWLGQSDWMTPEMADDAVVQNLIGTPNYTGFNDPTPERVAVMDEVVASLEDVPGLPRDKYPLPVFISVGGSGHAGEKDGLGNAAETLNENVVVIYDNGTDQKYPDGFDPSHDVPHNLQDVLLHEYGHAIQASYGHKGEWDTLWADYEVSDAYVPDGVMFKRPEGGLSFYAGTNGAEGFAEAFLTAVRISDDQYEELRPEAQRLVDYVREKVLS